MGSGSAAAPDVSEQSNPVTACCIVFPSSRPPDKRPGEPAMRAIVRAPWGSRHGAIRRYATALRAAGAIATTGGGTPREGTTCAGGSSCRRIRKSSSNAGTVTNASSRKSLLYTPTPLKSGEISCQPPLGRFWCVDDPPRLPGQRIAPRPDRAGPRRVRRPSAGAARQRAGAAGRRHELPGDRQGAVSGRRHDPGLVPALSGRWDRGLGKLRPRRGRVPVRWSGTS